MNVHEAYQTAKAIFPDHRVTVSVEQAIRDGNETVTRWIHCNALQQKCVMSERSWDHVLAIAKSGNEDVWEKVDECVEEGA